MSFAWTIGGHMSEFRIPDREFSVLFREFEEPFKVIALKSRGGIIVTWHSGQSRDIRGIIFFNRVLELSGFPPFLT